MRKILIFTSLYLPGVNGGGPIRSIANLVDTLGDLYEFYIITNDKDLGEDKPYDEINLNNWNEVGKAKVYYCNISKISLRNIKNILDSINFEFIYINSFFSKLSIKTYLYLCINRAYDKYKIIIAPRGEFAESALNIKYIRKKIFLLVYKFIFNKRCIMFQGTSEFEVNDVKQIFPKNKVIKVPNLSEVIKFTEQRVIEKEQGELRLVYISRIAPIKNLKFALECLMNVSDGKVFYDIYGPIEDENYWNECMDIIKKLPQNIIVKYKGKLEHSKVNETFRKYHAFFLPTKGENFGHVINESIKNLCVPIISNKTPWNSVQEYGCGWCIALNDKKRFVSVINELIEKDSRKFSRIVDRLEEYLLNNDTNIKNIELNKEMFML